MSQAERGFQWIIDRQIRRTVRERFRGVYWIPPKTPLSQPCIMAPNHHGWHDGYVMHLAVKALGIPTVDCFHVDDGSPLISRFSRSSFSSVDLASRVYSIRRAIRAMNSKRRSLVLFAEKELHSPPEVLPFGRSLLFVVSNVPGVSVVPIAIRYEMSLHERPECFLMFGAPVPEGDRICERTRLAVKALIDELTMKMRFEFDSFEILASGTADIIERKPLWRGPRIGTIRRRD